MTHQSDPLEQELRRIQPMDAPDALRRRIAPMLDVSPTIPHRRPAPHRAALRTVSHWLAWGVAAAMSLAYFSRGTPAAINLPDPDRATAASSGLETSTASSEASRFSPVSSSNILLGTREEGVVFLEDGRPARKVRYEFLDTVNLQGGEASRATLQVSYPREEIRLVPLQTF